MSTIRLQQPTTATPEQFVAGLTDFGPGREELFPNSSDAGLVVHDRGDTFADVTEGKGGVWERLHYDWSDLSHVVLTTVESNVWGGASGHTYTFTRQADGTTIVHAEVVRDGKNPKGKLIGFVLGLFAKQTLGAALATTVKAIEARHAVK
ncbi:hypothetical protein BBK82_32590 [Lentzea guizhouensis]|uniref:Polyketide cyclase n=1 Tax=Lentzea guizhouensis TaxID=1586287 RepID=A0A1B2HQV1_9PSEU|nr:hypothetical protein [Lentzea guizhouensis]ANZ40075.1 hypothetical protein BBK82_32590 [Lentzea guizhouensis]